MYRIITSETAASAVAAQNNAVIGFMRVELPSVPVVRQCRAVVRRDSDWIRSGESSLRLSGKLLARGRVASLHAPFRPQ